MFTAARMPPSLLISALLLLIATPLQADEKEEQSVGAALVEAIALNDVVAYSQCWISTRQMEYHISKLGIESPLPDLKKYHVNRNKSIAESFKKIQKLIADHSVERDTLKLKSCRAKNVREMRAPKGTSQQAGGFTVILHAGNQEWRFEIDDGLYDNGAWYFMDSPINLFANDEILSFHDHENEANNAVNRSTQSSGN